LRLQLLRDRPLDPLRVQGEIPLGGREVWRRLPVPDPLLFTGHQLYRSLQAAGIRVRGTVRTIRNPGSSRLGPSGLTHPPLGLSDLRVLASLASPPLLEILRVVNKESHNLFAEAVLRTLGQVVLGDGSAEGGGRVVASFLEREVGVPAQEFRIRDGSGLSPGNRASAATMVEVLAYMAGSSRWDDFWSTLPEAGARRELGRMRGTPAAGNLRAKTGTLEGVSALSGMVRTRAGERILFSILSNDVPSSYRAKQAEDRIGVRLASLARAP
jgi:D-alanyl-D-alanine carboxypeptidase/D-alanyl-D-alanine-endopeptidase (penicillin-binding protein 4)